MSYEYQPVDWIKFEAGREAILAEQDIVQATIDENMCRGNLFEAGVASLEHVFTSYELGDKKEAASYLLIGTMLSTAGTFAVPEHLRHSSASEKEFKIPLEMSEALPLPEFSHDRSYGDAMQQYREALDAISVHLAATETLLNNDFCSVQVKNQAVHDTVEAVGDFYFSASITRVRKEVVLDFVKQLAEEIEVDEDPQNIALSYATYRRLMLVALDCDGKTNSSLNLAARGFKELATYATDEASRKVCEQHVQEIRETQLFKAAMISIIIAKNTRSIFATRYTKGPPWRRSQAPKNAQENAKDQYLRIPKESPM